MTSVPPVPPSVLGRARQLARRVRNRSRERLAGPEQQALLHEVTARLNRQHGRIAALEAEVARISPQLAAGEARLEDLRQRLDQPATHDDDRSQALPVVEEIRREHRRIRARVSAATRYAERLRQLEETVARIETRQRTDSPST